MKRDELEHVILAAANIVDDEIVVVGSQAIPGQIPEAPAALLSLTGGRCLPTKPARAIG